MSKGENDIEDLEVAIKSKGGDCWNYDSGTGVVLDGNSWQLIQIANSDQALKISKNKEVRRFSDQKVCTHRYADQEVCTYMQVPRPEGAVPRIHSFQGKEARSCGVYHVWPVVLSPSITILWFWSVVLFLYYCYY